VGKWAKHPSNPVISMVCGFLKSGQKVGKWPEKVGKNLKIRPNTLQKSTQFFEKLKKPTLQKLKVGRNYINF